MPRWNGQPRSGLRSTEPPTANPRPSGLRDGTRRYVEDGDDVFAPSEMGNPRLVFIRIKAAAHQRRGKNSSADARGPDLSNREKRRDFTGSHRIRVSMISLGVGAREAGSGDDRQAETGTVHWLMDWCLDWPVFLGVWTGGGWFTLTVAGIASAPSRSRSGSEIWSSVRSRFPTRMAAARLIAAVTR
jgi:hypothetical protein